MPIPAYDTERLLYNNRGRNREDFTENFVAFDLRNPLPWVGCEAYHADESGVILRGTFVVIDPMNERGDTFIAVENGKFGFLFNQRSLTPNKTEFLEWLHGTKNGTMDLTILGTPTDDEDPKCEAFRFFGRFIAPPDLMDWFKQCAMIKQTEAAESLISTWIESHPGFPLRLKVCTEADAPNILYEGDSLPQLREILQTHVVKEMRSEATEFVLQVSS